MSVDELVTAVGNALDGCQVTQQRFVDNGDGTITDRRTGLMWEKLARELSVHNVGNDYTWDEATSTKIATLNSDSFAGHNDWRLPSADDLVSLVDYDTRVPAIEAAFNSSCVIPCTIRTCSCTASDHPYWTSTSYQSDSASAWIIGFSEGFVSTNPKFFSAYVRAVRGGY